MDDQAAERPATVLIYSDDRSTRDDIRYALGRRVAADLPEIAIVEAATYKAVLRALDAGGVAVAVFDGEAVQAGGMGLCRQVKDEVADCPPIVVLVARPQDAWLATWSHADAVSTHPVDPVALPGVVAGQLRTRLADTVA